MKKINNHTRTEISRFIPSTGICEYHAIIHITHPELTFDQQLSALLDAYDYLLKHEANGAKAVFKRFFLSDAANQTDLLLATLPENTACACSIVEQPPLDGTKIALWVYLQTDVIPQPFPGRLTGFSHNGYTHLWTGSRIQYGDSSEHQTRLLLNDYLLQLMENGGTLAANCLRTWFFVQNVDVNYAGVVKARKEVFATQNLTEKTHYIASTGIEGRHASPQVLVEMDAYSVKGLVPGQIQYLYGRSHLNPTYEYGVTFERGTAVTYGDRKHVFISGTASINNKGEILYPGDIRKQADRMLENVSVLLNEAGAGFGDVAMAIIYLRDTADAQLVRHLIDERFPGLPHLVVHAPVCRPGWLIEMECFAILPASEPQYYPL